MRKNNIKVLACSFMLGLFSCQTALKTALGIKNPEIELPNSTRMAYYQPFVDSKVENIKLYSVKDTVVLMKAYEAFKDYPHVMAKDNSTGLTYRIHCYDDMEGLISEINKNNLRILTEVPITTFENTLQFFDKAQLQHHKNNPVNPNDKKWQLFVVSGTFLGHKLRNRTVPITNLDKIESLSILDLSVNKAEPAITQSN